MKRQEPCYNCLRLMSGDMIELPDLDDGHSVPVVCCTRCAAEYRAVAKSLNRALRAHISGLSCPGGLT